MNPTTEAPADTIADKSAEELEKELQTDTLTSHDRCDTRGCGAQAYVRVELASGDLLFCNHHYNASEEKLKPLAAAVVDERWKLYKTVKLDVSA